MRKNCLLTIIILTIATGCGRHRGASSLEIDSTETDNSLLGLWHIENVVVNDTSNARPAEVTPEIAQTIEFNDDGFYIVSTNCNSMHGTYTLSGSSLRMADGSSTRTECDNMEIESLLQDVIPDVCSAEFENDSIMRLNTNNSEYIILRRD